MKPGKATLDRRLTLGGELTKMLLRMGWRPPERGPERGPKELLFDDDRTKHRVVVEITLSAPGSERDARNLLNMLLRDCGCVGRGTYRHMAVKLTCKGLQRVIQGLGYRRA